MLSACKFVGTSSGSAPTKLFCSLFSEEPRWHFSPRCLSINEASDCNVDAPEIQQTNQPVDSPEIYGGFYLGGVHLTFLGDTKTYIYIYTGTKKPMGISKS